MYAALAQSAKAALPKKKEEVVVQSPDAIRAASDFGHFCTWVADKPPAAHHQEWDEAIVTREDSQCLKMIAGPNTALLAPRGSAKSTRMALLAAWVIGVHTEAGLPLKIIYVSYKIDVARAKSSAIKEVINSPRYKEAFPRTRLKKGQKGIEYWSVDYEYAGIVSLGDEMFSLACAGLQGAITSKRAHLILIDDCIKNKKSIDNPKIRQEMRENWTQVISKTMLDGARAIALGTRFRLDDIYGTTFNEKGGWVIILQQALSINPETGKWESYWPGEYSVEKLLDEKDKDPVAFSFQMQNQPVQTAEMSFDPGWILRDVIPNRFDAIGVGIDLSASLAQQSDYTVFALGGKLQQSIYFVDYRRFRSVGNIDKIYKLLEFLCSWGLIESTEEVDDRNKPIYFCNESVTDIFLEAGAYQNSIQQDFEEIVYDHLDLYNIRMHPVKVNMAQKIARFRGVIGQFEQGRVIFNKFRVWEEFLEELVNLGLTPHDDCLDGATHLLRGLTGKRELEIDYYENNRPLYQS